MFQDQKSKSDGQGTKMSTTWITQSGSGSRWKNRIFDKKIIFWIKKCNLLLNNSSKHLPYYNNSLIS